MLDDYLLFQIPQRYRFSSKSQPRIMLLLLSKCCFRYHKGTDFQANHNLVENLFLLGPVVLDTTKVQIFKQITTVATFHSFNSELFQIPQRYRFSSKSQPVFVLILLEDGCFRYHKGTDFQANHNLMKRHVLKRLVVLDTTKVQIFKQITTEIRGSQ